MDNNRQRRKKSDKELLQEVEGIGPKRSEALLSEFGSGREVERASTSAWGRVADTEGVSEDTAQEMFGLMNEAGVRETLQDRSRPDNAVSGPTKPTDIGREADGEYARPEAAPDVRPAPVARNTRNGQFGLDPFDLTSGGTGGSVDLLSGGSGENAFESFGQEEANELEDTYQDLEDRGFGVDRSDVAEVARDERQQSEEYDIPKKDPTGLAVVTANRFKVGDAGGR